MLKQIISGAQNGVDIASLKTAKSFGLKTGGTMPKNFKTLDGNKPEYKDLYGVKESYSDYYPVRTEQNVIDSDATLRLYTDANSSGEKCTLRFILMHDKDFFDVDLNAPVAPQEVADWIEENGYRTINCAGNSENTSPGIGAQTEKYLGEVFTCLGLTKNS